MFSWFIKLTEYVVHNHITLTLFQLLLLYLLLNFINYWLITNNILLWRRGACTVPFGMSPPHEQITGYLEHPKRFYTISKHKDHHGWVVLFHSWGNNSCRLTGRAQAFWDNGYSLVFLDARSHGQSQYMSYTAAPVYAADMKELLEKFNIQDPIVYGTSFGGIAATILASTYPVKMLIIEAIPSDIIKAIDYLMNLAWPINYLFPWVPLFVKHRMRQWRPLSPKYLLPKLHVPVFLIHGEYDRLFKPDPNYYENKTALKANPYTKFWFVHGKAHANIDSHPEYGEKLLDFIYQYESSPFSTVHSRKINAR